MSTTAVKVKSNSTVKACHERQLTRRTLKFVNKIRADLGLKPVKYLARGDGGESSSCSIANTLTTKYTIAHVNYVSITVDRFARVRTTNGDKVGNLIEVKAYEVPGYVERWIARFDNGTYSGLKK